MDAKFEYFERESRVLFDREIPQILLIHANSLNADGVPRSRGDDEEAGLRVRAAFRDPHGLRLPLAGHVRRRAGGISWLHRWALTRGGKALVVPDEPMVPKFVLEIAGVDGE